MTSIFIVFAGFIIGLGAVTVIDTLGFLGRKSVYWTETTIRAHKVTKPLIWIGMFVVVLGYALVLADGIITKGQFITSLLVMVIMILNGSYLSFYISPQLLKKEIEGRVTELLSSDLQKKITMSFLVSFISWWGLLLLTIYQIFI
ncbi:MAG TPA: hypothetical protein PK886_02760 [Candidatus Paceibacterota bacterium]|nr:hypothetical protein [Candidatus Paceibacterota bacterium]